MSAGAATGAGVVTDTGVARYVIISSMSRSMYACWSTSVAGAYPAMSVRHGAVHSVVAGVGDGVGGGVVSES